MVKKKRLRPTNAELEILKVIWDRGPSTVRDIYEVINRTNPVGYTTILKLMQIMAGKGLISHVETVHRAHVYKACFAEEETKHQLAGDLLKRLFDGSAAKFLMHALGTKKASSSELSEIRELLDRLEKQER